MTITLELPPEVEARFLAEAKAMGVSVDEVLKSCLVHHAPKGRIEAPAGAEDVDRGFEDAADLIPEGVRALSDEAMSRESIYTREDDWNR